MGYYGCTKAVLDFDIRCRIVLLLWKFCSGIALRLMNELKKTDLKFTSLSLGWFNALSCICMF